MLIKCFNTNDGQLEWNSKVGNKSVFARWEYLRIKEKFEDVEGRLFVFQSERGQVVYPFFVRPVSDLSFPLPTNLIGYFDIFTPEYTGPLINDNLSGNEVDMMAEFSKAFHQYCSDNQVVSEFAHLHPWHMKEMLLEEEGVTLNRPVVYVDLTESEESIWQNSFNRACRKNIAKSQREGVEVFHSNDLEDIREFYRIYLGTMDRNSARDRYYFPLEYFSRIVEMMSESSVFIFARYKNNIIAATLYLFDNENVYSYLGGADKDYQHVRPTNAIVYYLIKWAQVQKRNRLILGGGYTEGDGIFRFKQTFSPLTIDFKTYKKIHDHKTFMELCECKKAYSKSEENSKEDKKFFPAYRE